MTNPVPAERWKPSVTVAAVIEHAGRYLLVEEHTPEGLRLNNPAGHLDPGESPEQAVVREAREETARQFTPGHLLGVYLARFQRPALSGDGLREDVTYLRLAYAGKVGEPIAGLALDHGIVRTVWLTPDEIRASADRLRSPLVLQCIEDHLAGKAYPLGLVNSHASLWAPITFPAQGVGQSLAAPVFRSDTKRRVVVGLSGGVDSAVSAWLLKQQGHEVVGIFMKNWEGDDSDEYCSTRQDFIDATAVADVIGIDIEHVNFAADYRERVFADFLREYSAGRTPNPDVLCNAEIKFKAFLDHALRLGAESIATGHYARARFNPATRRHELLKGLDAGKDQSYFLHRLNQAQLATTLFPVGELPKTEVRRLAAEIGLPNAAKKDSTGICFIGERPFREFLNQYLAHQPGPIKDDRGRTLGEHVGLSFYTLGQRKGIGIGGVKEKGAPRGGGDHAPWFVARKDMASNTLYVVQGHDHPWLLAPRLLAEDVSWVSGSPPAPDAGVTLAAKTRYRQADAACVYVPAAAGAAGFGLSFAEPQWAVTPGQSAVVYDGEVCLGGGVISRAMG